MTSDAAQRGPFAPAPDTALGETWAPSDVLMELAERLSEAEEEPNLLDATDPALEVRGVRMLGPLSPVQSKAALILVGELHHGDLCAYVVVEGRLEKVLKHYWTPRHEYFAIALAEPTEGDTDEWTASVEHMLSDYEDKEAGDRVDRARNAAIRRSAHFWTDDDIGDFERRPVPAAYCGLHIVISRDKALTWIAEILARAALTPTRTVEPKVEPSPARLAEWAAARASEDCRLGAVNGGYILETWPWSPKSAPQVLIAKAALHAALGSKVLRGAPTKKRIADKSNGK